MLKLSKTGILRLTLRRRHAVNRVVVEPTESFILLRITEEFMRVLWRW